MYDEKVSIIIPVYKVEPYLRQCLDSVISQTYTNLEIILVDDGSPDNCGFICDEYALTDSRIIVIHQKNAGVSASRNIGIKQSSGKYIVFVDSDDYISPDYVQNMMCSTDSDYVASACYVQDQDLRWNQWHNREFSTTTNNIRNNHSLINNVPTGTVWSKRYKQSILNNAKLQFHTDISRGEDTLFNVEYLLQCYSISVIDCADYYYRYTPGAATTKFCPSLFRWSMNSLQQIGLLIGHDSDVFLEHVGNNALAVCDNLFQTGKQYPFSLFYCIFEICKNHYVRKSFPFVKKKENNKRILLMQLYLLPFYYFFLAICHCFRQS